LAFDLSFPDPESLVALYLSNLDKVALTDFATIAAVDYELQQLALIVARLVTELDTENARAAVVRSYLVWELMELDDIDFEILAMQGLIEAGREVAAAGVMLDRLVRRASWKDEWPDLPDVPTDVIAALEKSVAAEPLWVENHVQLAIALKEKDQLLRARRHRDIAISNCQGLKGAMTLTSPERAWAIAFSGVLSERETLEKGFGQAI
jgi:hypothetical protein